MGRVAYSWSEFVSLSGGGWAGANAGLESADATTPPPPPSPPPPPPSPPSLPPYPPGMGPELFAVTSASRCAETLPYGPNLLSGGTTSPYVSTAHKEVLHMQWQQELDPGGGGGVVSITWDFADAKTVAQRFESAVTSGEAPHELGHLCCTPRGGSKGDTRHTRT